ncbi:MAG: phosphoethanolamine--lipid A transferase, partial [Pseudomonadales bacterium]|nr:phosphoethanolamine--lipid A transferase [Pseudomonadales bacterium]
VFLAGIPSAILLLIPVNHEKLLKSIFRNILVVTSCCICIGIIAGFYYQDYASLLRNNRHLRDQIIPLNFIYAGFSYGKDQLKNKTRNLQPVGRDAQAKTDWRNIPSGKKVISIIVIGETARAQSFSLGGYNRKTNPELEKQDIIYFDNFSSCGTTTSVSVPCMFSPFPEKRFSTSDAANHENLLDVLMHAGLDVLWRDNNSGCKGVCERVEYDDVSHLQEIELCNDDECYDEILLNKLNDKIESYPVNNGLVIVLHMHGSHGPDYFLRAPKAFRQFTPFCHTNQLQDCTRQEILNAYDNTILYSDHVLNQIIDFLKQHQSSYSSSLLFLSDHGESLGESNLYLHGLPRSIAPQEQTRIPAFLWLSESFSDDFHINNHCLEQIAHKPFSHDNLFHSVLGMLDLSTKVYQADLDLFRACKIETKADLS